MHSLMAGVTVFMALSFLDVAGVTGFIALSFFDGIRHWHHGSVIVWWQTSLVSWLCHSLMWQASLVSWLCHSLMAGVTGFMALLFFDGRRYWVHGSVILWWARRNWLHGCYTLMAGETGFMSLSRFDWWRNWLHGSVTIWWQASLA